ncbi:MAG: hypothetical protein ACREP9_02710 [Candidatus Dormibacteraceae bacterium]
MAKVLISVPDDLLERVDRAVASSNTNRSGFFQNAAFKELGWPDSQALDSALARGRKAFARFKKFDSVQLIREERDFLDARDRRR